MAKHKPQPTDAFDKLVDAVTKEVAKRLRPTPQAVLLNFRITRIRAGKMGQICDVVVTWVPATSGVKVQHFAATVGTSAPLTQDVGPAVNTLAIVGVPDTSSIGASIIEDNGIVQSPPLTGSYVVDLTAPAAATLPANGMFQMTNVRPEDGSTPTLTTPAAAAPETPATTPTA
jgi:hypothetical protein